MEFPWSEFEVESLVHLVDQHAPLESICATLNRGPDDVLKKIRELAIQYHIQPGRERPPEATDNRTPPPAP